MKLIFDHNLSRRLVRDLADVFPGSVHVQDVHLEREPDQAIWEFAKLHGLAIASKDSDFHQRSLLEGSPPKVIWIQRGNCTTAEIEKLLRARSTEIAAFGTDREASFLELE